MSSEEKLIERVRRKFTKTGPGIRIGIGDDAALVRAVKGKEWVVTTDAFLENVHFLRSIDRARAAGYKALARATSDLAAMGARGRYFLLTLAVPDSCTGKWLDRFLDGMALAARRFGLLLIGGDTTKYPTVIASLTVIGEVDEGKAILRSGAKPGDSICVSGKLGEAELGLRLVQKGLQQGKKWGKLTKKHLYPEPRLALGQWLVAKKYASAMIDSSDGLSTDLSHICKASGVGARIWAAKIPSVHVPKELRKAGLDPLRMALDGGEDYELLFTVPRRVAPRLPRKIVGIQVTVIGEIVLGNGLKLVDAKETKRLFGQPGGIHFEKVELAEIDDDSMDASIRELVFPPEDARGNGNAAKTDPESFGSPLMIR